ncbi:MAG: FG-GAP-like repeat-containing protein [Candidatus Neomarinimicrobiota bacterium]
MKKVLYYAVIVIVAPLWGMAQPTIVSFTPTRNALNVEKDVNITVTFDRDIDQTTINNSTIKVNGSLSGPHIGTFSYNSSTYSATIDPSADFKVGDVVTVTLTGGIKSTVGDSLAKSYTWSFLIKSDVNSSGQFVQSSTPSVGSNPLSVTAGDFNGDGSLDLAVSNSGSTTVSILINNGSGTFTQSSTPSVGSNPWSVTAGDFNGDGSLDLAVSNWNSTTVSILINNGSGTFTQSSTPGVGSSPYSVIAGDFNGDGSLDLAVANCGSNTISVLINNGSGTFTQSSTPGVGSNPLSATAGDFNGDGSLDLAVANSGSTTVSILINNGSGTFTQSSTPSVGSNPYSVTAGDFNGDGSLDLAVANYGSNTVSILINNGSGTFTQRSTPSVGSNPWSVTAGDFNGDGSLDLAVANYYSNTVSILLNRQRSSSISLSTNSIPFGSVGSGSGKSVYLKIMNNSTDSTLFISNITSSNAVFTVNRKSLTISPDGVDSVQITFIPTAGISYNDSLTIISNDPQKPIVKVYVTGFSPLINPVSVFNINLNGPVYAGLSILGNNILYAIATGDAVYRMDTKGNVLYNLQVGGEVRSSSSIAYDTTVYIASSDRNLYAFSKDGNAIWSALPLGGELTATPAVDSVANQLYIGVSNRNFVAVNQTTGLISWSYFSDAPIKNSAVISRDRKLIFVTQKGTIYGFDLNTLISPASPTWQIALQDTAPSSIALDDQGFVYLGIGTGRLLKIAIPTGQQPSIVWQVQTGSSITGSPVIDANGTLYVGSTDSKLYAVDIQTGNVKWTFTTQAPIQSTPAISDAGIIYCANDDGEVFALDTNKTVQWYYKASTSIVAPLLYYNSTLYLGTLGNQVIAIYDGLETPIPKSVANQATKIPVWGTFQGNNQRTGISSSRGVTKVQNLVNEIPTVFALSQNYPNPFNPSTTILFDLPKKSQVSLKIYNLLGREVTILVNNEEMSAGSYSRTWNAANLPSGVYFYHLQAGSFSQIRKLLLIK